MALTPGDTLGPYEVVAQIGRGGMGEVYRARDRRLQRDVAIKMSASRFSERFEREARAIAALNHPNVCTLFDIGPDYLVMELVEGVTLSDRISLGPLPVEEALAIARQIAEALEAAHERGIVHRDLKPGNVMIRPDGMVKVLDFGVAKQFQSVGPDEQTQSVAPQATQVGTIIGTAAYMSPEQATGHPADRRADIWAFGVVLHEMVTGRRLFGGQTTSEILANVIAQTADLAGLPTSLSGVVEKCLRKDPRRRWQWIGDVRLALDETPGPTASIDDYAGTPRRVLWTLAAAAILCTLGFAIVSALYFGRNEPVQPVTRFTVPIPGTATEAARFELSPNGRMLAIASIENGRRGLWLRPLDSLEARLLPGTEGAESPFWSPDSATVGFFADGRLMRVPITGGASSVIAQIGAAFTGASWNDEATIVFSSGTNSLHRVDSTGRAVTPLRFDDLVSVNHPRFLPDGRHLLFRATRTREAESGIFAGALDASPPRLLAPDFSNAGFARSPSGAPGYLVFARAGSLMSQSFDAQRLQLDGNAFIVAELVAGETGRADFSLSNDGTLAYRPATLFQLTWVDRAGAMLGDVGSPGPEWAPGGPLGTFRLSPDETKVAYARVHGEGGRANSEVWQLDLLRNVRERLTFAPGPDLVPVWSPDSRQVVYASNRNEATGFDAYVVTAGSEERVFAKIAGNGWPLDWSRDGRAVLQLQGGAVWTVPADGAAPSRYFAANVEVARFAPDGLWVAYVSNDSGPQSDVYVRPFPGPGSAMRVSEAGGTEPQWRRDGRELFYVAPDGTLMAVPVTSDGTAIRFGQSVPLFASANGYQAVGDGQRFLVARRSASSEGAITVVLNWQSSIER